MSEVIAVIVALTFLPLLISGMWLCARDITEKFKEIKRILDYDSKWQRDEIPEKIFLSSLAFVIMVLSVIGYLLVVFMCVAL
jgi:preprotein translocase subunit Sss1